MQMFRHARRARAGFTLIELLVVVIIIGILASTALPSLVGAQDKARNAKVVASLNTVRVALEMYGSENNGSFPDNAVFPAALSGGLPGGRLPISPWATGSQTVRIQPTILPTVVIEDYTSAPAKNASFVPATAGAIPAVGAGPSAINHYGAILTDCDDAGDRTRYLIYGIGKKGRNAIIVGTLTNFGR